MTTDTPQRLRRTAFDHQLTDEAMLQLLKMTIALIGRYESATPWRDLSGPEDRINTAILALLSETRTWNPANCDLVRFLYKAIESELGHEVRDATKRPSVSLDDEREDQDDLDRQATDGIALYRVANDEIPIPIASYWSRTMAELRLHARGDRGVLAILDAYDHRAFTPDEVIAHAGMSESNYRAAYKRLLRVARKVDEELLGTIMQAIA